MFALTVSPAMVVAVNPIVSVAYRDGSQTGARSPPHVRPRLVPAEKKLRLEKSARPERLAFVQYSR